MGEIVTTIEIDRPPGEVFPYVTDPSRFNEWQPSAVSGETKGAAAVGSTCTVTRKVGGMNRTSTSEIIELEPPTRWAIRGLDGPVRADVSVLIEPTDEGRHSRLTVRFDMAGHGLGKLIAPMVIGQVRKEVPTSCSNLKRNLEASSSS
jgi:uncharacterized protein YndB with AHSA1/START domain